jgi:hypothetical protein
MVRVGRNANFRRGMKLLVKRPAVGARRLNHGHMTDRCHGARGIGDLFRKSSRSRYLRRRAEGRFAFQLPPARDREDAFDQSAAAL